MNTAPLRLFWWCPSRHLPALRAEIKGSARAWCHLRAQSGRWLKNFGDELSPIVLQHLTGREVVWAPPRRADAIGIGSIIEYFHKHRGSDALVFGSGLRGSVEGTGRGLNRSLGPIVGLRGPLSKEQLGVEPCFLGDPGVLVGDVYGAHRTVRKVLNGQVILIPHFRAWQSKQDRLHISSVENLGVRIVSPASSPEVVLGEIRAAQLVLTSSLHGLICAHAMGVPTQFFSMARDVANSEPTFKFDDYLATIHAGWKLGNLSTDFNEFKRTPQLVFDRAVEYGGIALERTEFMREEIKSSVNGNL
ncbi:polysaccharide pyruvyl transferase family protein [Gordonia alkanivorans]|uniref:polysaccharide pyruvyl transferase family protein n=1 Tax=Gordonia alkanivorans TaxID=84096 RepID=UPI003B980B5B